MCISVYIGGKGIFCSLCRWYYSSTIRHGAQNLTDNFKNNTDSQTLHQNAVTTEPAQCKSYSL